MTEEMKKIIERTPKNDTFLYQLLDRLRFDCDYFLGNGHRLEKVLWSGNIKDHIEDMKALHNNFDDGCKPEWLTMEQIEELERQMKGGE